MSQEKHRADWSRLGNFKKTFPEETWFLLYFEEWLGTKRNQIFQGCGERGTNAPWLPPHNSFLTGIRSCWGWSTLLHLQDLSCLMANAQEFPEGRNCLFDLLVPSLRQDALFQELNRIGLTLFSTFPGCLSSVCGCELLYPLSNLQKD